MLATLKDPQIASYSIDDPEIMFGELEIHISAPFDAGHVIHLTRQLQKYGCITRHSFGSFRHGCLITASMEDPIDIISVIANAPGIRDAQVIDTPSDQSENLIAQWPHRHQPGRLGVQQIEVTTEPRKEEIQERLETLNRIDGENEQQAAEGYFSHESYEPRVPAPALSDDGWTRRLAFDIRNKSLRR